ncbi:uncharacterized protein LOC132042067 [Lycium ferocissimum]|uniref:uncharacterized protein LOC132042067 n=1 Tax=Lycium ferocissimum TaxID=112874 RepID=UPI00281510FE|nr:uncharacterized protein LOC132042067 [Lycium ferocissimum]
MKKVSKELTKWSKETFGDIFKQVATLEEVIKVHDAEFEQHPTKVNRERLQKVQADLIRVYAVEEKFWKQKAGLQWFKDGDRNTKFFHAHIPTNFELLDHIPHLITAEQNAQINELPEEEEVKKAVFGLNSNSAGGPDGYTGKFFQSCWSIIAKDGVQMAGFVKGRSIVENILLVQEIVHDMRLRGRPANVVIKLDMTKAYDRVSWLFLTKVLRKMGFGEFLIDMVHRIISNNWYSILINGQPCGFFKSTTGVKKGDPLSPTLFILASKCLSRALNALHYNSRFSGFGMPKWSPYINHLAYADDTIIFTSAEEQSLQVVMETLAKI